MKKDTSKQIILPYNKYMCHRKVSCETCGHLQSFVRHEINGEPKDSICTNRLFDSVYTHVSDDAPYALFTNVPTWTPLLSKTPCPYCKNNLSKSDELDWSSSTSLQCLRTQALSCGICGWWVFQHYYRASAGQYDSSSFTTYEAIVYSFDVSNHTLPITAIRHEILKKGFSKTTLSSKELELLVGSILRDYRNCSVKHVGGPGDNGIDLLLVEADDPVIVQVKYRKNHKRKEAVSVIRELLGTMLLAGTNRGIVASTAPDFSDAAKETVENARKICGYQIDLYNQRKIRDILKITESLPKPWASLIPELH